MIELQYISIGYNRGILLDNQNATFHNGQLIGLVGRNGCGKSTLLRAIAGLEKVKSGDILLDGVSIASLSPLQKSKSIAFVSTEKVRVSDMRCCDLVSLGRAPYTNWIGRMQKEDEDIVFRSLATVGMIDYAERIFETLSDGECQRVMIARALAQDTSNIILDEPTSFLDIPNRYQLCSLLAKLAHCENKCVLFSTHEIEIALEMCDSIVLFDKGRLLHLPASAPQLSTLLSQWKTF